MDETIIKRVMPNSLEAEQSVIGSMIMDKDAIVTAMEMLLREDFYHQQYGVLFETMVELYSDGQPVDLVTLQNKLKEKDVPKEVSSLEFVRDLVTAVPTSANIKYYATIVKENSVKRKLIHVTEGIENDCYAGKEALEVVLDRTEKEVFGLLSSRTSGEYVPIRQVVMNALEKIEKASKQSGNVTGIPTGFTDLDYRTAGLQPSDLILVAARPSMGKTAFVLNIAQHVAFHEHMCTAIFSLEMSKEQLVNRLFSLEAKVDAQALRTGNLSDADWEKLVEGAGIIADSELIIDDTPGISITEMRSKCRKYKLEHDLKLIIIDYLQLMSGSGGKSSESRQQEISDISRSLKALARELSVPVIALSQLSRAVEQRPDHRPMLSDLRESGAIEQDADVVMFIYRDDYYNHDTDKKGISEIIIAKQRNGPIGTVNLAWLAQYTKFGNLEHSDYTEE
ncbi:MAG: replicative DNA helicase [Agathobacter sp.]